MRRHLAAILVTPALVSALIPFSESSAARAQQTSVNAEFTMHAKPAVLPFLQSSTAPEVSADEKLAMHTKPSVVRIVDGYIGEFYWPPTGKTYTEQYGGSGSGFFINPNGYIVTNAHVTEPTHKGEDEAKNQLFNMFLTELAQDYGVQSEQEFEAWVQTNIAEIQQMVELGNLQHIHHVLTPDGNASPFEIKAFGAPVGEGKDVSVIKIEEINNAPVLKLGDSDEVGLQEHITVAGYPGAADTFETGVLDQKSVFEATFTDGKLSTKKNTADGAPVLQVSAPATHGSSGGPVLNDEGEVIGLLTFGGDSVNGQEVSGFTFVIPSNTVMEFVREAGTTNEEGLVDKNYDEGLQLFWQKRYKQAIEKFEEARRLFPQHSEVEELIQESQQAIAEGKQKSNFPLWAIPLLVGAAGVTSSAVLLQRRRKDACIS